MAASYFVIIFLVATSFGVMSSISNSINNISNNGNEAKMAITNLNQLNNTKLIPEFDSSEYESKKYIPSKKETAILNMNNIDIDSWSNLKTFDEKFNFLRIFPYTRSELIPHNTKVNYEKSNNNNVYKDKFATTMTYVGNPLLELPLKIPNAKYAYSASFFDPFDNKMLINPKNILLSYNQDTNNFSILGVWNNGSINNDIKLHFAFTAFKNTNAKGDSIFNNPDVSKLELNRNNKDTMITNKYGTFQLNDINNLYNDISLGNKNYDLIKNKTYITLLEDYLRLLPFKNPKNNINIPKDGNVPYIEVINGFSFPFVLSENANITDIKFQEWLKLNDPNNELLKPLILDEYNLLGMNLNDYQLLSSKEKEKINDNAITSLRKYANFLSDKWNEEKNKWVVAILESELEKQNILTNNEYQYYYQSLETKHEFLYVPKNKTKINNLVIDNGIDLPYKYNDNVINDLNLSYEKKLSKQDLLSFLNFIKDFSLDNDKNSKKFSTLTEKCFNDLNNSSSISEFNEKSGNWTEWMLRYGNPFKQNFNESFDCSFSTNVNSGFTSLYFSTNIHKINLTNNFVVLSNSYYQENKKKHLPISGYELISGPDPELFNTGYEGNQIPLYSLDSIIKGEYDHNILDLNNFDEYLKLIPEQYKISYFDKEFLIIGSGISPDYSYPIVNIQSPIPNPKTQAIVYVTNNMFNSILNFNNTNNQISYISLWSDIHNDSSIANITHDIMLKEFGNSELLNVTTPNDINGILSLRYELPKLIQTIIIVGTIAISLILFIILLYVSYMMLNIIIEKMNNIISICRAEGFSKWKIALCIAIPLLTIIGGVCILSYLLTFLLTPTFLGTLSGIWFLPLASLPFDWYILLGSIAFPAIFILLVVFSLVYIKFRKPILDSINDVENTNNRSFALFKNISNNFSTIWKYRFNLFFSKFSKLLVLILSIAVTFGLGLASFTITENTKNAITYANKSKKYNYSVDLVTPQENTGLYKEIPYYEIGLTNNDKGIEVSNIFYTQNDPYGNTDSSKGEVLLTNEYLVYKSDGITTEWVSENELNGRLAIDVKTTPNDLYALRDDNGNIIDYDLSTPNVIDKKYYTNYILPSYNTYTLLSSKYYSNFLHDSILSIFLVDVDIAFGGFNLGNLWLNFVKPFIPQKIAYQMEVNLNKFKKLIYETYPTQFSQFIKIPSNGTIDPNNIQIDANKTIIFDLTDFNKIRYNNEYLKFLGTVFGNKTLANNDVKLISGSIVPLDTYNNSLNRSNGYDETYTWTTSDYLTTNGYKYNNKIKIVGIKPNSSFIKLYGNNEKLLDINSLKDNEIIINNGAAHKYKLDVGDEIIITPNNDYFNSSFTMAKYLSNKISNNKTLKLRIKSISNDSVGESFYTKQSNVNKWINLDKGKMINNIWMNHYQPKFDNNVVYEDLETYLTKNPNYIPFNGIFTNREFPLIGDKAIMLTTNSGLYSCYFNYNSLPSNSSTYIDPKVFSSLYSTNNKEILSKLMLNNRNKMIEMIENNFQTSNEIVDWLSLQYKNIAMFTNLESAYSLSITNQLFSVSDEIITNTNTLLLSIFIPILISTIIVSIIGIIDLVKKQIGILRLLGYTSGKITRTILYLFLPSIILSGIIGAGVLLLILYLSQNVLFDLTSIFVSTSPNFLIIVFGISLLIILLFFISIICYILLRKLKYSQLIKNTYN